MKFDKNAPLYTNHAKSQELFTRALKVVPCGIYGHLGPAEGCMIPVSAYPLFSDHAKGSHICIQVEFFSHSKFTKDMAHKS